MKAKTGRLLAGLVAALALSANAAAATIWGPMIDQFNDSRPNDDVWYLVADASGTITANVYEHEGAATISIDGLPGATAATSAGTTTTISVGGLVPGSTHVFTHTQSNSTHYRPEFLGVDSVYMLEDRTSPNDVYNSSSGAGAGSGFDGSNIELGFDGRFDSLPSTFADTTWYYWVDPGDVLTWRGFFDDFPLGADAARIEMFDANGTSVALATTAPLLPGAGTTLTSGGPIAAGTDGWWSVKLSAPATITPYAGHYLMDVTVKDVTGAIDPTKSSRHYLLPTSFTPPPGVPEPATALLLGGGLIAFGASRRRRG